MYLEQNLKKLETLSPRLAKRLRDAECAGSVTVVTSKAGLPSIKIEDALLHSLYDPAREARDWVEHHQADTEAASSIAVLGVGFGYHVEELLRVTNKPVVAFEPRLDVLRAAATARDMSALFSRVKIACCPDDLEVPTADGLLCILRYEPSVRLDPAAHKEAESRMETLRTGEQDASQAFTPQVVAAPEEESAPDRSYYRQSRPDIEAMIPVRALRILDIGCGEGVLGRNLLKKRAIEVVGIEADPAAAEAARKNLTRVLHGDAETMDFPFEDGYFDCVVLADVLEHMRDPLSILKKAKRCLSGSGVVVASIPNVRFIGVLNLLVEGRWEYRDEGILDRTHLRFFTRKEMEILFCDAGFELEKVFENMAPEYASVPSGHKGDITFGRVALRDQTLEEIKDLFVIQYVFRVRKVGLAAISVNEAIEDTAPQRK
ncbi:MAG: class I SAM-dependent methyltransferase [Syntrophorhabdaceae bacterium]|nr:class I SAM-dependent methyltransferase [Syntrophorhabdaceae bacterium]